MYVYKKQVPFNYADAVDRIKEALKEQGFGILTEVNVAKTLKSKLNVDFDDYIILGACNPSLAYKALNAERDIGAMLPCNIIVYLLDGNTFVAAILPTIQLAKINNPALIPIAGEAEQKLKCAVDKVSGRV